MSALMDESAAWNSLQAIKTVFGLSNLFTVGCGKALEKARLLHYKIQNAQSFSDYFPNIDFTRENSSRANITTLFLFLADQPLPCFFFGKRVFKFQRK